MTYKAPKTKGPVMTKKKPKTLPQYSRVEQPFGMPPLLLRCPICGQVAVDADGKQDARCPHLAFVYLSACGEFEYMSPDFAQRFGTEEPSLDAATVAKTLKNLGYENQMLAIEVTYGGMACGPVWYSDIYGFDFSAEA
jgi:hypothetical protein